MKKYYLYIVALTGALTLGVITGCNKAPEGSQPIDRIAVNLKVALERSSLLKVANDRWEFNDRVGLYMKKVGTPLSTQGAVFPEANNLEMSYSDFDKRLVADEILYYPKGTYVDMVAYYPYNASIGADYTIAVNLADQTTRLPDDILYSNNAVDLEPSEDVVELVFKYSFAKVVVTVFLPYHTDSEVANMTLSLSGMNTQGKLQLSDGTFTDLQGGQAIRFRKASSALKMATFEALVMPSNVPAGQAEFVINVGDLTYSVSAEGNYAGGGLYPINFLFSYPDDRFVEIENFSIDQTTYPLTVNRNFVLRGTVVPSNAFYNAWTWRSDNPEVADVVANSDNTGKVTGKAVGTANIIATTINGSHSASCRVDVRATGNRLNNAGFEDPYQTANFTTSPIEEWTDVPTEWFQEFYKMGEEKAGPKNLGPGNGYTASNRVGRLQDANFWSTGNGAYFANDRVGDWAGRLAGGGGATNTGGFYQLIYVTPGETYRFSTLIGVRPSSNDHKLRDYETIKILSPDGMEIYHLELIDTNTDTYVNYQPTVIKTITGTVTIPGGVTQIRFQFDQRAWAAPNQTSVTLIDECVFELVQ